MKKFLVCHTEGKMDGTDIVFAVVGKKYEVIWEGVSLLGISDERGNEHSFGKGGGEESYTQWFSMETVNDTVPVRYFVNFLLKTNTGDLSLHYWVSGDEATNTLQAIDIAESRMSREYGYTAKNITNAYVNTVS
jgi:hypothetical protein